MIQPRRLIQDRLQLITAALEGVDGAAAAEQLADVAKADGSWDGIELKLLEIAGLLEEINGAAQQLTKVGIIH